MSVQPQAMPAQKIRFSSLFTTGLALFSMFFGAGNLIFPLIIGQSAGCNVWSAIFGLGLTAVAVPFLGLAAMVLFQADCRRFFGTAGRVPGFLLLLLLQLILGPFGVIPRLVTLMHAMAKSYLGDLSLMPFSLIVAAIFFACSFKKQFLIGFLGAILTPVLLLALAALVYLGISSGGSYNPASLSPGDSFFEGLLGGYNTMDLIAAFLFATVVLPHFQKEEEGEHPLERKSSLIKKMFLSSAIAALLLMLTYVGLCMISAYHGWSFAGACPSEELLGAIAIKLLGPIGGCIAVVAVITACLSTAITLASIFADYLRKDLCKEKIGANAALILTLAATTLFANLGFEGISAFLGPILQVVYPGLILLTVLNLLQALYGRRMASWPVFGAFAAGAVVYVISF